jgi:hypothetical protein
MIKVRALLNNQHTKDGAPGIASILQRLAENKPAIMPIRIAAAMVAKA